MNKNRTITKALGFLLAGILIALVFTITPGTYSLYTKEYIGPNTRVEAANTDNFIKEIKIIYKGKAPYLKLKRSDDLDYAPVIFFSLEGEIKDYVLHMDSVRLEKETIIPIVPNVNLPQSISLLISSNKEIEGKIKIKHLNDFIDEELDVKISKDYLLERYFFNRGAKNFRMNSLSSKEKDEMGKFVGEMILYTSSYMDWDRVIWQEEGPISLASKSLPISKAKISLNQASIIEILAPDLLKYNEKLYSLLEVLVKDLNKQVEENNVLKIEKERLAGEIRDLEKIVDGLENQAMKLRNDNDKLYDEIRYLEMDNEELKHVRREFRIEKGELYNYIRSLEDEKEVLGTVGD